MQHGIEHGLSFPWDLQWVWDKVWDQLVQVEATNNNTHSLIFLGTISYHLIDITERGKFEF